MPCSTGPGRARRGSKMPLAVRVDRRRKNVPKLPRASERGRLRWVGSAARDSGAVQVRVSEWAATATAAGARQTDIGPRGGGRLSRLLGAPLAPWPSYSACAPGRSQPCYYPQGAFAGRRPEGGAHVGTHPPRQPSCRIFLGSRRNSARCPRTSPRLANSPRRVVCACDTDRLINVTQSRNLNRGFRRL